MRAGSRLHADAAERQELRALQKVALEEAERAACSFQPVINDVVVSQRPIHERVADLERRAAQRRLALEEELPSFRPHVDARSARLAKGRPDVASRLAADAWARADRERDRKEAADAALAAKQALAVFRPLKYRPSGVRKKKPVVEEPASFRPTLTRRATSARRRGFDGLNRDAVINEEKRQAKRAEMPDDCTFRPELVAKRQITPSKSLDELSSNPGGKTARAKAEAKWKEEYSFKPDVRSTAKSRVFDKPTPSFDRERLQREKELDDLRECSFRPNIHTKKTSPPRAVVPVVVRGLARHLELRDRARQLDEAKRLRQHNAFRVDKADEWRNGQNFTTPVPFALHNSS